MIENNNLSIKRIAEFIIFISGRDCEADKDIFDYLNIYLNILSLNITDEAIQDNQALIVYDNILSIIKRLIFMGNGNVTQTNKKTYTLQDVHWRIQRNNNTSVYTIDFFLLRKNENDQ